VLLKYENHPRFAIWEVKAGKLVEVVAVEEAVEAAEAGVEEVPAARARRGRFRTWCVLSKTRSSGLPHG
jgi:hypothetical protein